MCGRRKHSQNKSPQTFDTLAGKNIAIIRQTQFTFVLKY